MEGSVKSLIEAEEEARKIVDEAQKQRKQMLKDADTKANQLVTLREQQYEVQYAEEQEKVTTLCSHIFVFRKLLRERHCPRWTTRCSRTCRRLLRSTSVIRAT